MSLTPLFYLHKGATPWQQDFTKNMATSFYHVRNDEDRMAAQIFLLNFFFLNRNLFTRD